MIGNRYEYSAMASCEQELWWYRCLHELTIRKIKSNSTGLDTRILDAGCGTGGLLLELKKSGYRNLTGFDLSPDAVQYATETTGLPVATVDICEASSVYGPGSFDVIVSNDILCLLKGNDDATAMRQLFAMLKPGGVLLMNFPAYRVFKGTHDLAVGIQRRYTKNSLKKLVGCSGRIVEILAWPFLLSFPIMLLRAGQKAVYALKQSQSVVSDVRMPARRLNDFLYRLTSFDNNRLKKKPWGSSLFTVIQKTI